MTNAPHPTSQEPFPDIDTTRAHTARVWNYWLGGKDNYPVDRVVGEQIFAVLPDIVDAARAQRAFLVRVVRYLAPAPCSPARLKERPTTSSPTCVTRTRSCGRLLELWTSPNRSR